MINDILAKIYSHESFLTLKGSKKEVIILHKMLENLLLVLNDSYYNKSISLIEDREYDDLLAKYDKISELYNLPNKLKVGSENSNTKIHHKSIMLSLANCYNSEELLNFLNRNFFYEYCCELKIDGVSFNLIYDKGILQHALSRGNGVMGENIRHHIPDSIPRRIGYFEPIEIRGEFFMYKSEFIKINEERKLKGLEPFSNPRNTVSGILRNIDKSPLSFDYIVYGSPTKIDFLKTQFEHLQFFKKLGFKINDKTQICHSFEEIQAYYNNILSQREWLNYEIDGLVVKLNDSESIAFMEKNERYVKYAIAYKFPAVCGKTTLLNIQHNVGRNGKITPLAIMAPVHIGGVIIQKATLHNILFIINNDIRINDTILLERAGDVIPKIQRALPEYRNSSSTPYTPPTHCPACNSILTTDYTCDNSSCKGQQVEYLKYFVRTLDIKHLGPKIIEMLFDNEIIFDVFDILSLAERDLFNLERFKDLAISRLLTSIQEAKNVTFSKFVESLGIPEIGSSAAKTIAIACNHDIDLLFKTDFTHYEHIGERMQHHISQFLTIKHDFVRKLYEKLNILQNNKITPYPEITFLVNKRIGISGSFSAGKEEIIRFFEQYGIIISNTFSKTSDILFIGDKPGSKLKIAQTYDIPIYTEEAIRQLMKKK